MFPDLTRDDVFRIETARLWLRWPRAVDASSFVRLASDPDIARRATGLPAPFGLGEADDFVLGARRANADGRGIVLAMSPRNDPGAELMHGVKALAPALGENAHQIDDSVCALHGGFD